MIYPRNFETKTGFNKIRQMLKEKCIGTLGASKVDEMRFDTNEKRIVFQLSLAKEFKNIILFNKEFPQDNYLDTRIGIKKISIENTWLTQQELFDLKQSCNTLKLISQFFRRDKGNEFPTLKELCEPIFIEQPLIQCMQRVMDDNGEIRDNASAELSKIRAEIKIKSAAISAAVSKLLKTAKAEGWCDSAAEINIRDGKLLIPIQSSNKRKIKGIVCDESSTGKTSFIEPLESIELNNEVKQLEFKERREIIKILIETSDKIRPYIPALIEYNEILAELDFARAKAKLAIEMIADMPHTSTMPILDLRQARHPILDYTLRTEGKKIIPIDVEINDNQRIIMISGPNAGGKSVCLKTTGIIQYMHQCGLLTPTNPNSTLGIFKDIFIDIGDEQSIENDLSTYSSHLVNMKFFLDHANKNSLILIDEFGTGTEPILGGAIAEAILDKLNQRKTKGIITTHYTNLKNYATETEGLANGAMLYDNSNMKPLFELEIGKVGNSFAFETARRIGINEQILQKAEAIAGRDHIDYEKRMQELDEEKRKLKNSLSNAEKYEENLKKQSEMYATETEYTVNERRNILRAYKSKFEEIIKETNKKIERAILEIKNANADKVITKNVRQDLENFKKEIAEKIEDDDQKINEIIERIHRKEREKKEKREKRNQKKSEENNQHTETVIKPGDKVYIDGGSAAMIVNEIKDGKALINNGVIQTFVDVKRLTKANKNADTINDDKKKQTININFETENKKGGFLYGLDVRGLRGMDAVQQVAKYIDQALSTDNHEIKILHGTGTGALKSMIRDYLRTQNVVATFYDEKIEFGGAGITVVELDY